MSWKMERKIRLPENVRKLRKMYGMTKGQLANAIGVSPNTIAKLEWEITEPRFYTFRALAEYFEISMDDLVYGEIKDTKKPYTGGDK